MTSIDPATFRDVLGHYPTGVVVVTGMDADGKPLAMVVGTFTSVSLDPPLVAFLPMRSSSTFAKLSRCDSLCINVLTSAQEQTVRAIASRGADKLGNIDWFPSPSGDPILADSLAWLDVRLHSTIDAGDHWIALCRVADLAVLNPVSPLLFFQGGYGNFVMGSLVARMDDGIITAVQQASLVRGHLESLATSVGCQVTLLTAVNADELAAVATAVGAGMSAAEGLGERIPMVPPIGDTYLCHADTAEQDRWLGKATGVSTAQRQLFADRLAFCREHGYLASLLPTGQPHAYDRVHQATQRYSRGRLTPAEDRAIRAQIIGSGIDYRPQLFDAGQHYDLGALVLPCWDGSTRPTLTLRLSRFPPGSSGAQVNQWIDRARQASADIAGELSRAAATTAG